MRYDKLSEELKNFKNGQKQMEKSLVRLKKLAKEEGAKLVTDHLTYERSEAAKKAIDDIKEMSNLTFKSNEDAISRYIEEMFGLETSKKEKKPTIRETTAVLPKETETEVTLDDVKTKLQSRGYELKSEKQDHLVFKGKSGDNYFVFPVLTPKTPNDIKTILGRSFRFRNIAFVCMNHETKMAVRSSAEQWVESQDLRYLTIHFTTVEEIDLTENFFDVLSVGDSNLVP